MSPNLRRAAHQALDILLDAIAEGADKPAKKSRRRGPASPELPPKRDLPPEDVAKVRAHLERAGYRRVE